MIEHVLRFYAQMLPQHRGKSRLIRFVDKLRFSIGLQKVKRNDITWFLDTSDHIQWHIYYYGIYEPEETHWIKHNIRPGMVVFDVGANIGYYTLITSTLVGQNGQVHSFEASLSTFQRLKEHIEINKCKNTIINHAAVSNKNGQCKIFCASNDNIGQSSMGEINGCVKEEVVNCFSLDSYVEENGINKVDFIKVDVEGAEMLIVEGAISFFERFKPIVMMEINPASLSNMGTNADSLIGELQRYGYEIQYFEHGRLEKCKNWQAVLKGKDNVNFIFVPEVSVDEKC